MGLKILKADDPIEIKQLIFVIYGAPGLGKSTLGFTAHKPMLIDFDHGVHRAAIRLDSATVDSWSDVTDITETDLKPYETVIVDTAGRALDFLTVDIIKSNPKMGYGGALTLQGYGQLKSRFTAWLNMLKSFGKDVVLISHMMEDKKGDELIERLDVQGGSKGELYKSADAMGRIYIENRERMITFSPTDTAFGKNPANIGPQKIPNVSEDGSFLGNLIEMTKEKINTLSEAAQKKQDEINRWVDKFGKAKTPEDFGKLADQIKWADESILPVLRGSFRKSMKAAGISYDKDTGYVQS
jgi:hypothetical protein